MKKNNYLIIFSAAIFLSALIIGGSVIYVSKTSSVAKGIDESTVITDDNDNEYVVEKDNPLKLTIISDKDCENCKTDELESFLKTQTGTSLAIRRLEYKDSEAEKLLSDDKAKFLPYIIVDRSVEKLDNYVHLTHHVISQANSGYYVDLIKLGATVGRYLDATYYAKDNTDAPKIYAEKTDYDFGDVSVSDGKVSTAFIVKNTGKAPLEFLNANTSCGCTSAMIVLPSGSSPEYMMAGHKEPVYWNGTLDPGEEGKIVVFYDPNMHPDLNGAVTREVTIDTNDPATPQLKLKIYVNQVLKQ